jgi:hypothetical protein
MNGIRQVSADRFVHLLRWAAPTKSKALDDLMASLRPKVQIDTGHSRILFSADSSTNTITVGLPCTYRLQAYAYAYAIILSALETPGYLSLSSDERKNLRSPAFAILNWAVSRDLQHWLKRIEGTERPLRDIFGGAGVELPEGLLNALKNDQRDLGECWFRRAAAFILLHELAHLYYGHVKCKGYVSIHQEKDADRFAAEWLTDASQMQSIDRLANLYGIAVALLWPTLYDAFFGPRQSETQPPGHERLYQVLDQSIDRSNGDEGLLIWDSLSRILSMHCDAAGIQVQLGLMEGSPRDRVNYLIDLVSKKSPW